MNAKVADEDKTTWWPECFALSFLGAAFLIYSLTTTIVAPEPVTVPLPEASRTITAEFPSDGRWSGGEPYLSYKDMSLEEVPKDAYCEPVYSGFSQKAPERYWFSCSWSIDEGSFRFGRTKVAQTLPVAAHTWNWEFDRHTLTLTPVMTSWLWANSWLLWMSIICVAIAFMIEWGAIENRLKIRERRRWRN